MFFLKLFGFKRENRGIRYKTIKDDELENFIKEDNVIILDVRTTKEFNYIRLKNAINIPLDCIRRIEIDRSKKFLIYCLTGKRTMKAIKILYDLGYYNLYIWGTGGLNTLKNRKLIEEKNKYKGN